MIARIYIELLNYFFTILHGTHWEKIIQYKNLLKKNLEKSRKT